MELASARGWRPFVMAFGLVMGTAGQLGDGAAPASFGDKSCPLLSALRQRVGFSRAGCHRSPREALPRTTSVALVDDVRSDGVFGLACERH